MPASVNNSKKYKKSASLTEVYDFEGRSHWTCGAGLEEVPTRRSSGRGERDATPPARLLGADVGRARP